MKKSRGRLATIAKTGVGLLVVAYVIVSGRLDFPRLLSGATRRPGYIAAGFAVLLFVPVIGWIRWWLIVRAQRIDLRLFQAFRIQMIGMFFNAFLLGTTGGDIFKAYYIATGEGKARKAVAVMTLFLDRFLGLLGLFALCGAGLLFGWGHFKSSPQLLKMAKLVGGLYGVGIVALGAAIPILRITREKRLRNPSRLARVLIQVDDALQAMVRTPLTSGLAIAISIAAHFTTVVSFYCFAAALGVELISLTKYLLLAPLALAITSIPVLPLGGLGAGEFFASVVFGFEEGVERWVGGTVLFLWRMCLFVPGLLGFAFFIAQREEVKRAISAAREEQPR